VLIEGNDPRLIDVAVLSKLPLGAVNRPGYREQCALASHLWGLYHLNGVVGRITTTRAAVLAGPDGTRLVALHRPERSRQFLIGALIPDDAFEDASFYGDTTAPRPIAIGADPARAAADVTRRLLPGYHAAVEHKRLTVLSSDLTDLRAALVRSSTLGDRLLHPRDDAARARLQRTYDVTVWNRFTVILDHGPALLAHAEHTHAHLAPAAQDTRWRASLDALATALAGAESVRIRWVQTAHDLSSPRT
jgi:hypothetical protein